MADLNGTMQKNTINLGYMNLLLLPRLDRILELAINEPYKCIEQMAIEPWVLKEMFTVTLTHLSGLLIEVHKQDFIRMVIVLRKIK